MMLPTKKIKSEVDAKKSVEGNNISSSDKMETEDELIYEFSCDLNNIQMDENLDSCMFDDYDDLCDDDDF